jgi:exodeoxyribonuclease VII large subunit
MTASDPDEARGANIPEFTVGELSAAIKRTVEGAFAWVRVRGEISRPSTPASGHCYLRLKDETAVLDAVLWKGTLARLGIRPEEGMEVICTGRLTTYPGKSTYQLIIERMELAGAGALLKMIEERRKKLAAEGLFDAERKQPIPYLPDVIGVITSPTGAVIRDILHRLADRFPRRVLIWPVSVQGEGAAEQVAAAIRGFNALQPGGDVPRPDLLIVARGGGSIEDLMPFNEEIVVRAAADSAIALISAVGHETDTTLIDFAADWRAPTPSAAAERAVPVRGELIARIAREGSAMVSGFARRVADHRRHVEGLARGLGDPRRLLEEARQRVDDRGERLALGLRGWLAERRRRLDLAGRGLTHPRERLARARDALAGQAALLAASLTTHRRLMQQGRVRADELGGRARAAMIRLAMQSRQSLSAAAGVLESVSPLRVLDRGYAIVRDASGNVVTQAQGRAPGEALELQMRDGRVDVTVGHGAARPAHPRRASSNPQDQGRLL